MSTPPARQTLLEFPCDFPLKIIGQRSDDFAAQMLALVHQHAPDYDAATTAMRPSSKGHYLALTCTIRAQSQQQLDALYQALVDHPLVKVVL